MADSMLKLGIMGLNEGNGHPYSFAAIFNGYDEGALAECPFAAKLHLGGLPKQSTCDRNGSLSTK